MKRLLLFWAMFLCSITATFAQFSGSGSGTKDDPYLIFYADQLAQVSNFLNKDSVYFKLMSDIDLTDWLKENANEEGWTPIGVESSPFKGILEGNSKKVTGLMINTKANYVGFFGNISSATIRNLQVEGNILGNSYVGGITGSSSNSAIENCSFSGSVEGNDSIIGGLAGSFSGSINNCNVISNVEGLKEVGGAIGISSNAILSNITIEGSVNGKNNIVGGAIGNANNLEINNLKANVDIKGGNYVGGILGQVSGSSKILKASHSGQIITSGGFIGGVIGFASSSTLSLSYCNHSGDILGSESDDKGGIIGRVESSTFSLEHSNSYGKIYGGKRLGGIIGSFDGYSFLSKLSYSSHIGNIDGHSYLGGLIGKNENYQNIQEPPTLHTYESVYDLPGTTDRYTRVISDRISSDVSSVSAKGIINNSYAISNINGKGSYVGGIIGYNGQHTGAYYSSTYITGYDGPNNPRYAINIYTYKLQIENHSYDIKNCYFTGNIEGDSCIGGIAGAKICGNVLYNYSEANIKAINCIGGIVGSYNNVYIKDPINAYSVDSLMSNCAINPSLIAEKSPIHRICSRDDKELTYGANGTSNENKAFAKTVVSLAGVVQNIENTSQDGRAVGPSQLKLKANYVAMGWDFNNDWTIQETETYPYKPWQPAPPTIDEGLVSQSTTVSGKSINGGTVYIEIGDNFKTSVLCSNNKWSISTGALQSGDKVRAYAVVDGMGQSPYTDAYVSYPGSGTESDPYLVYTAADLQGVYKKGYYKLMNDIDLTDWINKKSSTEGWPAIGKNGLEAIYFDGNNHKVTGLWCKTTANYNGLFSNFPSGYIKNLRVETASGKTVEGGNYTGVLIGCIAKCKIMNVTVNGTAHGKDNTGVMAGYMENCELTNAAINGNAKGTTHVGGVAGSAIGGTIKKATYQGELIATADNSYVGGIAGYMENLTAKLDSTAALVIDSGKVAQAGALAGRIKGSTITKSIATGSVTATGDNSYAGGLVGTVDSSSTVTNCYATASTTSTLYGAGLVAYNYGALSDSYAKGDVNSTYYGAGLVGYNDGSSATLNNSVAGNGHVNVNDKSGWSIRVLGGFKNGAPTPGENNYALNTMILSVNGVTKKATDNILDGFAKTEEELMSKATYQALSWDFNGAWTIDEGKDWPQLDMTQTGLVTSVTVAPDKATVEVGKTVTLTATVAPDDAENKKVVWSSSNTKVAMVKDGVVTGVSAGTATITVSATDGSDKSASAEITVYAPANDSVIINDTTVLKGKTVMIPVIIGNKDPFCSFQFDIYLPDGMSIAKNSDGDYDLKFAGRQNDTHSMTSKQLKSGAVRVVAFSAANKNFSGNDGAIINIPVVISNDIAANKYAIAIKNIVLADKQEQEFHCKDTMGIITVIDYIMGDANGDEKVTLADVNATVNYIIESPSENFVFAAADMNHNNTINVSDVNAIVNLLLDDSDDDTAASSAKAYSLTRASTDTTDKMYCNDISIAPGETKQLQVSLDNEGNYCSFQFDLILPEGISVVSSTDEDGETTYDAHLVTSRCTNHMLASRLLKGNKFRVVVFSLMNKNVSGTTGPVVNINLKAEDDMTEGEKTLKLENITLATKDEKEYYPTPSESKINVTATGINNVRMSLDPSKQKIYNLQGQKVNKVTKGVYIVNGKKIVIDK